MGLVFIIDFYLMSTKCPMSPNSSCFIEPRSSYHPFALSCATTDLSSTSSPMQTINHPLVTPPILTNHTPPISSPYQPPTLCVNVGSQPYTFPNPFNHAQLQFFAFPLYWSLQLAMIIPLNLPPFLQHAFNLHLKCYAPLVGTNLPVKG
jgi:hypothetical protein